MTTLTDEQKLLRNSTGLALVDALDRIADAISGTPVKQGTIYGFHIDSHESDPSAAVTYLEDAVGMTPAYMDFDNNVFNWGSWHDAFFMPRPCMLKYDGTVDYYLDENDYNSTATGGVSDVRNMEYAGNAMMEWGRDGKKIWYKIVPDEDPTSASIYIADHQADSDFYAYSFINNQGEMVEHFYTAIYNGTLDSSGRLRSISGVSGANVCNSKEAAEEIEAAELNNPGTDKLWDTEVYADILLIQLLLTLISKSLNSQTAFGKGLVDGYYGACEFYTTGTLNSVGLFYGTSNGDASDARNAVKVFGMENWWGFQLRRFRGLVSVNNVEKFKLTRGTQDGSTVTDYVVSDIESDYDGYMTGARLPGEQYFGYITKMLFFKNAMAPTEIGGSVATYYCDRLQVDMNGCCYAVLGGTSYGDGWGAWAMLLAGDIHLADLTLGAALSCKPLA